MLSRRPHSVLFGVFVCSHVFVVGLSVLYFVYSYGRSRRLYPRLTRGVFSSLVTVSRAGPSSSLIWSAMLFSRMVRQLTVVLRTQNIQIRS
jgi:hypothetical protein